MVSTADLLALERRHSWHPFTQMQDWCAPEHEPLILCEGEGALLRDRQGREYIDGNSSIWTNLHGHCHPKINEAIREQLDRVAHTSFLGFTNPPAIELAAELAALWPGLPRVFFSDDGSTAIEAALKMAIQARQQRGETERVRFIAFENAYHGDTMGASSLGGISTFHGRFAAHQFPVMHVPSMDALEACEARGEINAGEVTAVIIEPLIQGSAGMRIWPQGMLARLRDWCDQRGVYLIVDEVMTGFGRTGTMFACEQEGVTPDFAALAKGLTGGYLPLAATLVKESVYEAFLGNYEELKTFFYGHSYTANQLGCAAALANLAIFREEQTLVQVRQRAALLSELWLTLGDELGVRDPRQCGLIAAFDLCGSDGEALDWREQMGAHVCVAARKHGLLTRPIRDTVTFMPPYCITEGQLAQAVEALRQAVRECI